MKKTLLFAITALSATLSFAQAQKSLSNGLPSHRTCGSDIPANAWEQWFSAKVQEYQNNVNAGRSAAVVNYTIPIIIHIIHSGTAVGSGPNISYAQAQSQVAILNADYAGTNADITNVPAAFTAAKAGNTGIQFCLAKVDPTGNVLAEPGVERINRVTKGWTDPNTLTQANLQTYFDGTIKPASIWDPTKYMNVWIAQMDASGLLGYASFPAGTGLTGLSGVETATTSGVVINEKSWGNIGTATAAPYNKGRTASHEVGHWLGLRHIWGDANCATDYCADTPPAQTSNFSCPTHPYNVGVCAGNTTGEMFMNYMDYVDDACMYMFTANQATRMQTAMANGTYRVGLNTSGKCNTPFTLDASISAIVNPAAASSSCATTVTPVVTLTNSGSTTLTSVTIKYSYDGGTVSNYAWTGSLASGNSATVTLPTSAALSIAAHTITVATNLPNGSADLNTANDSKTNSFTVTAPPATVALPFTEGFQAATFVPAGWALNNPDADVTWVRATTAGGFGTSTASTMIDNYTSATSTVGFIDELKTPKYNFTGLTSATLKFDVAYARYNATFFDSLIVLASSDCGVTWNRVYAKGSTALATAADNGTSLFVPTAAQWRTETVSLNSYIGQSNVGVILQSKSGWGQALYLDNINIIGATGAVASVTNTESTGTNPMCAGSSATFTATPTNGGTTPTYQWQVNGTNVGGATASTFTTTTLTNGQIVTCVMTSNLAGVTGSPATSNGITMTVNPNPTVTVPANNSYCSGASVPAANFVSTPAGATFAWTNSNTAIGLAASGTGNVPSFAATNATASPIVATISVTPTSNGCVGTPGTYTITVNPLPASTFTQSANQCLAGNSFSFTNTGGAGTYSWTFAGGTPATSTGNNPTGVTFATAGTHAITHTVTSAAGCASTPTTSSITIFAPPTAQASTTTSASCATANGSITLGATTGGTGPYTFSVDGSAFAASTNYPGLLSGSHSVIVKDSKGCQFTTTVNVPSSSGPTAQVTTTTNETCGGANGSITLGNTTGGVSPYTYSVDGSAFTSTTTYTGLSAGSHVVSVKDANGCTFTTNPVITNIPGPTAQTATTVNSTCGNSNGVITIGATTGGVSPYTYSVNGGAFATTTSYTGLAAGSYPVVVKDVNGCTFTTNVTIANTAGVTALATTTTNSTCGGADGSITIGAATGGTAPYTYSVNGSASTTTTSYTGLAAGSYPVIVTDANGCSFTTSATVSNTGTTPATPTITQSGSTLTSSSATGNQWYLNGSPIAGATGQNYTFTVNGDYTVVVTTGGCSSAASATTTITNVGIADATTNPNGLSVYPNPNDGNFTVSFFAADKSTYKVEIFNTLGQSVFKTEMKDFSGNYSKQMSVVEYGRGVYTISLTNAKNETVKKIIVY